MTPEAEGKFDGQFSFKLSAADQLALVRSAKDIGSTKDIVLRELVRAFNDYCASGRRPTFPFALAVPGYRIEAGKVIDDTPLPQAAEPAQSPYAVPAPPGHANPVIPTKKGKPKTA